MIVSKLDRTYMIDIYFITLKERTDRLNKLIASFEKFKNINLIKVDGVKHIIGAIGCFMSHQKCIQLAKDNKMKNIFVIEDDCTPVGDDFEEKIIQLKNYFDNIDDWCIFLGGGTFSHKNIIKKFNDKLNLYLINHAFDMHFVCYNNIIFNMFLKANPKSCPIDHFWKHKMQALVVIPFIAIQDTSYSDIINEVRTNERFNIVERRLEKKLNLFQ